MQSLKDAAVVLGLLLLVVSVKVAPVEPVSDGTRPAQATPTETDGGTALAGFVNDPSVPVIRLGKPRVDQPTKSEIRQIQVDADTFACESSIVHVHTLEFEETGDRIILRIDAQAGRAEVERLDAVEPAPSATRTLEACKIG
jgi:hypothetical protein